MYLGWIRGESCIGFWWRKLRKRDHWGNPGVDGRILLRWIVKKYDEGNRLYSVGSR
jgi:hypothetical protein